MLKNGLLYRDFGGGVNSENAVTELHIFTKAGKYTFSSTVKKESEAFLHEDVELNQE